MKIFKKILLSALVFTLFLGNTNFNIVKAYTTIPEEKQEKEIYVYVNRNRTSENNVIYRNKQIFVNKDFIDSEFYTITNYNSSTKTLSIKNIDYDVKFTANNNKVIVNGKKINIDESLNSTPFIYKNKLYVPLEFLLQFLDEDYLYNLSLEEENKIYAYVELNENEVSVEEVKQGIRETQIKTTSIDQEKLAKILSEDLKKRNAELVHLGFASSEIGGEDTDFSEEWNIKYKEKSNKKIFSQDISLYPITEEQKYLVKFLEPKKIGKNKYSILIQSNIADEKEFKNRLETSNLLNKMIRPDSVKDFTYIKSYKEKHNNKEYIIYELQIEDYKYKVENFLDSMFINQLRENNKKIKIVEISPAKSNTKTVTSIVTYSDSIEITTKDKKYIVR